MCGFAGVVSFSSGPPDLARRRHELATPLLTDLAHRGPDGSGTWLADDASALFVHRRLAVLDPTPRSSQPFVASNSRLALVYNGEIFNFRDLRRELDRDWQTQGDTEVVLAAYEAWGDACVERFDGMFALAIYDQRNGPAKLFLARDPAGEKPLYVTTGSETIAFASELRPLRRLVRRLGLGGLELNRQALREYLAWGYVPEGMTIHAGIQTVRPGTCRTVTATGTQSHSTFDAGGRFEPASPDRWQAKITGTRTLVAAAVEKRLVSDVPVGCLLSGGIDSSIVALHMARALGKGVPTFSIGFDNGAYDERPFAEEVARSLGCDHHSFRLSPESIAADDLPRLVGAVGQPFADSSILPTRLLCEQVRQHVTVALGGDGGDELFGGYDRYRALLLLRRLNKLPGSRRFLQAVAALGPIAGRLGEKNVLRRVVRLADSAELSPAEQYAAFMRVFSRDQLRWLAGGASTALPQGLLHHDDPSRVGGMWFDAFARDTGLAATATAVDRATYLPGDLLTKVDRASMLHGLEVRCPMVDADLLRFASTLRDADLTGPRRGKRLLREAFGHALPTSVFSRKKQGFAVPIASWLRGKLRPMLRELLFADDGFSRSQLNTTVLELMCRDHQSGRSDHGHRLFALLMLELWWRDARDDITASTAA